jgi:hypothetical protein
LAAGFGVALLWLDEVLALLVTFPPWPGVDASVSTFQSHIVINGRKQQNTTRAIKIQNVF